MSRNRGVAHPGRLRTAEGRRRARDLKLLVDPSDPTYIYIGPYDPPPRPTIHMLPTTYYDPIYKNIYIYIYTSAYTPYGTIQ